MPNDFFCARFAALAIATPLSAYAADGPSIVDPLVVTASRSGDLTPADLVGASVTVVDDQALQQRQTLIVSDVLRDVPGVAVSRIGAVGGLTQVRIRGAEGNHTLVMIDGIKASDPFFDEYDFGTLLADPDARIEVVRGQQSSLYGSDAIGGVINYITLTGSEAPGMRLRAEGGSLGTYAGGARVAGVNGDLDFALSASGLHTNGYRVAPGGHRDVGSDSAGVSTKVIWSVAPNLYITAVGRYSYTNADTDDSDLDSASKTFGQTLDSPGVHYVNTALYGLLRGRLDLMDGRWTNALAVQVADTHRSLFDVADPYAPLAGQPIAKTSGDHGERFRESFESAYRFGDAHVKQRVTVAFDAEQNRSQTTVSPFGAFLGQEQIDTDGLVAEYDLTVADRTSFGASVRHDWNSRFSDDTTYRIEGSYKFSDGLRLHAAAGSGVKNPSFGELFDFFAGRFIGNANLQPEKSTGWEAGVDAGVLASHAKVGVTYFSDQLTNAITTSFATGVAQPVNLAGSSPQRGVEVFASAQFRDEWRLDAGYTYLDAPQHRRVLIGGVFTNFDGQAVRRARDIASLNVSWAPLGRPYAATVTVRYNGKQGDLAFTDPSYVPVLANLKAFTLVNFNATWRLNPQIEFYGRIENLFDQSYQEVFSFATPGRTAYAGVRLRY